MIVRILMQYMHIDRKIAGNSRFCVRERGGGNGITNIAIFFHLLTYAVTLKHLPSSRNYGDK